jgi:hypothetical protein
VKTKLCYLGWMVFWALLSNTGFSLPYDWKHDSLDGTVTRCFAANRIQVRCEDLSEPDWSIDDRAELQIVASNLTGRTYSYSYEHGLAGSLCREHLNKITSLLRGQSQACVTGIEREGRDGNMTNAKWQAFESSRGRVVW